MSIPTYRVAKLLLLWHRWLNELQMLLFSQAVNAEREGAIELPINGDLAVG